MSVLPAAGWSPSTRFFAEDAPVLDAALRLETAYRVVSPGYFDTMGIPIVRGRAFSDS